MNAIASFPPAQHVAAAFRAAVAGFGRAHPVLVLSYNDADGLSAAALFARAFAADGQRVRTRVVGRGESPWSEEMRAELGPVPAGGVVVADLGVQPGLPKPGVPTIVVDHHIPGAPPPGAAVVTGYGMDPIPTSSLLAYWCVGALADAAPWLWIAATGLIGDMAEDAGFPEMAEARRYGITALQDAASLVNVPRRTASGDASPALALLMTADGRREITKGVRPEAAALRAAKAEVKAELDAARRVGPTLRGEVVLAANAGYRPG